MQVTRDSQPQTENTTTIPMIVDGHEDIAYNILTEGRDFTARVTVTRAREDAGDRRSGVCTLALPELLAGGVGLVFGTLFTLPAGAVGKVPNSKYSYHTSEEAHNQALAQLAVYRELAQRDDVCLIRTRRDLKHLQACRQTGAPKLGIVLLMENGDPIRTPTEVAWWQSQGVRIVGPAWQATRYCGGTRQPGPLTAEGCALMGELARAGLILDMSHMAEESFWQALDRFDGAVIASHSNCRAYVPTQFADRHLSDEMLSALIARDAVIGVVLFNQFLAPEFQPNRSKQTVGLDAVLRHIDHICQIAGNARHVAIGSDFDGGFGNEAIPRELDSVADLPVIGAALRAAGYSQEHVDAIMGNNWLRVLERALPEQ